MKMNRSAVEKAEKLQIVCRTGVGTDNVDKEACRQKGVLVANTPDANTTSVVEHTIALALALSKRLPLYNSAVREGNWKLRSTYVSCELYGKTAGIVGYGRIGRRVAQVFRQAFGMQIIAYDPFVKPEDYPQDRITADVRDVFREADVVTMHCPSIPETKGMVNAELLRIAKPSMILVNCARGDVLVEADLVEALQQGVVAAAGLDVFENEPVAQDNPLCAMDNVILTPHIAALTMEASVNVACQAVEQALIKLDGGTPPHLV